MRFVFFRSLAAGSLSLLGWPAAADETQATHIDLMIGGGYSTNPGIGQSQSSSHSGAAFGRISANATHEWSSERTVTKLMAFWEGSEYIKKGAKNLVSAEAEATHSINERLIVSASGDLRADFSGQLSNRFLNPSQPGLPDTGPGIVGPPTDLFLYNGREYRGDGQIGLAWSSSERTKVSASTGVRREVFSGPNARDNTTEFGSASYDHLLSERTILGLQLTASRTDFDQSKFSTVIVNPAATIHSHLSEDWKLSGSLGASFSNVRRQGASFHTIDPSFSTSICREDSRQHLCATASHYAETLGVAALVEASTFGLDWVDNLDANQTVQVSGAFQHYGKAQSNFGTPHGDQYRAGASYSRHFNERFSVGANATASRLANLQARRRMDISGWLFVRYRIGDLR